MLSTFAIGAFCIRAPGAPAPAPPNPARVTRSSPRPASAPAPAVRPPGGIGTGRASPLGAGATAIGAEPLLTAAEERALAGAIRRGEPGAADRFILANLRLVVTIARGYQGRGLELEDLVGEGNLGLIRAVSEFDPGFGVRFSTYASYWIKEAIRSALTTTGAPIRLPAHMVVLLGRWRRAERAFIGRHGHPPTPGQLAAALGLGDARRRMVEQALQSARFLAGGTEEEGEALEHAESPQAPPDAAIEAEDLGRFLRDRLSRLDDRERAIVIGYFGLDGLPPRSQSDLARQLGITREWVRKLRLRAIETLAGPDGEDDRPPGPRPGGSPACPAPLAPDIVVGDTEPNATRAPETPPCPPSPWPASTAS